MPLLTRHVPPPVALLSGDTPLGQTARLPLIEPGVVFTVTTAVVLHPVAVTEYVMVAVPGVVRAVTRPVVAPIVAMDGVLLLHLPPVVASARFVVVLTH